MPGRATVRSLVTRPLGVLVSALVGSAAGSAARQAVDRRSSEEQPDEVVIAAPLSIVLIVTVIGLVVPRKGWLVAMAGGAVAGALIGEEADRYVKGAVGKAASLRARADNNEISGSIVT